MSDSDYLSSTIGGYRCGLCREPGHYQRTCPKRSVDPSRTDEQIKKQQNYLSHKDERIGAVKEWKKNNPDLVREYYRRFWEKNGERVKEERNRMRDEAYRKNPKETWLLEIFRAARVRAKRAGIPFDNEVPKLELPDICPVLGIAIVYHAQNGKHSPNSPSLDRIVPELGYVFLNLRVISNRANTLKNNASLDEMRLVLTDMERLAGCVK